MKKKKLKYLIHLKAFNYVDSEGNHVITKEDFTKDDTIEVLEHWLGPNEDWEEEFDNIDLTNKKGEGNVLFRVSDQSFFRPTKYVLPCLHLLKSCYNCRNSLTGLFIRILITKETWEWILNKKTYNTGQ